LRKRVQFLPALLLLLLLLQCHLSIARNQSFSFASNLGVAVQKPDAICLYIHNPALDAGALLTLVLPAPPQSIVKAEIVGPASANCINNEKSDPKLTFYEVRLISGKLQPSVPVIAVSAFLGQFQNGGKYVRADFEDGRPASFRFCTSSEGVHLTVWSGKPLHGLPKWHQYYYLGYDIEPTCTPQETKTATP
jgi:hypothetical protein